MSRALILRTAGALALGTALCLPNVPVTAQAITPAPLVYLDQGAAWQQTQRESFYSQDQGSQMIPYSWLKALTTADGQPFLRDQLQRYGYLANPATMSTGLPVGFTLAGVSGSEVVGMNCAACHTRDIAVAGTRYRVDGGPALSDFQGLLTDMVDAVGRVVQSDATFQPFAAAVLGSGSTDPAAVAELRATVTLWYQRENAMKTGAYRDPNMWGLGRLDAVSMIFNRLTGLDIGPAPSYLIPANIMSADAPVRYPFLWNAARQDKTQWPGFADNGNNLLGLARNLGEVYGVFGIFHPAPKGTKYLDFLANNSANFSGLGTLEASIKQIGAPRWPWQIDKQLAQQGAAVWKKPSLGNQSCASCHDQRPGAFRGLEPTWKTPVLNVGTDTREWAILGRPAQPGVLAGRKLFFFSAPIGPNPTAFQLLSFSVIGSIVQQANPFGASAEKSAVNGAKLPAALSDLTGAFPDLKAAATPANAYESRVMYGIWAAAPYLHNGSVPTLADLLKPSAQRPVSFKMGRNYDLTKIGIAADQEGNYTLTTTGCDALNSGNSRCGHEYGTEFSDAEKTALLEFMKGL